MDKYTAEIEQIKQDLRELAGKTTESNMKLQQIRESRIFDMYGYRVGSIIRVEQHEYLVASVHVWGDESHITPSLTGKKRKKNGDWGSVSQGIYGRNREVVQS
jgi:hypothetical protein